MCIGDNDLVCHGAWATECRGRGESEGQGRGEAKRHVSAHVRPVALEALSFSMVGGVPEHEILNKSDRPPPCPPLEYLVYGRGIFQVVLA
jgi:hypothetical protein